MMGYPIQASQPGDFAPLRKAPGGKFGAFLPANRVFVLTRVPREFRSGNLFGSSDGFRSDARLVNTHPRLAETSETPCFLGLFNAVLVSREDCASEQGARVGGTNGKGTCPDLAIC